MTDSASTSVSQPTAPSTAPTRPFIETSTPAINEAPVELDGIPTSPAEQQVKRRNTAGSEVGPRVSPGLGEEEDINEEFLGEGERGAGKELREKRAAMLATRSKDPGVIVDVPQDPTAEEVEAAGTVTVTPGLPNDGVESVGGL